MTTSRFTVSLAPVGALVHARVYAGGKLVGTLILNSGAEAADLSRRLTAGPLDEDDSLAGLLARSVAEAQGRKVRKWPSPVCAACGDSHKVPNDRDDGGTWMCVWCPLPCQRCRANGRGAYCGTTPCDCGCHRPTGETMAVAGTDDDTAAE